MPRKPTLDLSKATSKSKSKKSNSKLHEEKEEEESKVKVTKGSSKTSRYSNDLMDMDDDDDNDDELIATPPDNKGDSKNKMLFIVLCVFVAIVIVLLFVILMGRNNEEPEPSAVPSTYVTPSDPLPGDIGTQDFTQNTNMSNSNVLTDPDSYVEDIHGLTTRVDYTVKSISSMADFVNYEKHRGTWGGGMELYWLDVTYNDSQYVIQVPFKYYKELSDTGVIPVKMEVLTIQGSTSDELLYVISYMELDEYTLKQVLNSQNK